MQINKKDLKDRITEEMVSTYKVEFEEHEMARLNRGQEITFIINGCIVTIAKAGPVGPRGPA